MLVIPAIDLKKMVKPLDCLKGDYNQKNSI